MTTTPIRLLHPALILVKFSDNTQKRQIGLLCMVELLSGTTTDEHAERRLLARVREDSGCSP